MPDDDPEDTDNQEQSPHDDPNQEVGKGAEETKEEPKGEEAPKGEAEGDEPSEAKLTDEQVAELLTNDSRFRESVLSSDDVRDDLDAAIDSILKGKEQERDVETKVAQERQTLTEAVKAYNEGNKDALADYALDFFRQQRAQELTTEAADSTYVTRMQDLIWDVYPGEMEALGKNTSEVRRLDRIQNPQEFYRETLKALGSMRQSAGDATADDQARERERAVTNAATATKARGDANASGLPGGTPKEGAEGMDVDALIREGFSEMYE